MTDLKREGYGGTFAMTDPEKIKQAMNTNEALQWINSHPDGAMQVQIARTFLEERYGTWQALEVHEARLRQQLDDAKKEKKQEFWNQVIIAILAGLVLWGVTSTAPLISIYVTNVFPNWKLPSLPNSSTYDQKTPSTTAEKVTPNAPASTSGGGKTAVKTALKTLPHEASSPQKASAAKSPNSSGSASPLKTPAPQSAKTQTTNPGQESSSNLVQTNQISPHPLRRHVLRRRLIQETHSQRALNEDSLRPTSTRRLHRMTATPAQEATP